MKKSVIITVTILALAFLGGLSTGCKKKACDGGKKAGALQASAQKELGVEPSVSVSINLKSMRKSKLYNTFKDRIAKKNFGDSACGKEMMDTADSLAVVAHSPNGFKGDGKDDIMVAVLKGMDADKAMACIKKSPELKISTEKVNGKTFDAFESDSKKMYLFKADATAIVIASEAAVKKLVPGKGTLGRGNIDAFMDTKTISFKTGALGGMVKSLSGNIDMADGISFHAVASLVREKDAQMAVTSFEQAKNMPGLGDLVKKISLSRSGTTLTTGGSISREDIDNLKNNPMLGALMRK